MQLTITYESRIISPAISMPLSYLKAQEQSKIINQIKELESTIASKRQTANYLAGKKRGSWGRITEADKKRSAEITHLCWQLQALKNKLRTLNQAN